MLCLRLFVNHCGKNLLKRIEFKRQAARQAARGKQTYLAAAAPFADVCCPLDSAAAFGAAACPVLVAAFGGLVLAATRRAVPNLLDRPMRR